MENVNRKNNRTGRKTFSVGRLFLTPIGLVLFSIFYFLSSIFDLPFSVTTSYSQEWKEVKSEHFFVYHAGDEKFAQDVSRQAEKYYKDIASELGYQRYSEFWTWDNRVKILIYPDKASFIEATGQPDWSEGVAKYYEKEIASYAWSEGFLDRLLPHEMAHLIFRDYVGFKGEVPLWLDEGVAQWMEPFKRERVMVATRRLAESGRLLSLKQMMSLDVRKVDNPKLVEVYYVQAVSLVGFLIREYKTKRFTTFCRQLRDGKSIEDALTFSYPVSLRSIEDLEEKWKKYIMEE